MSQYILRISLFLSLLFSIISCSQNTALSKAEIIDFDLERTQIPGETMGQKLESLLYWTDAEKQRRFPHMHQIYPSIEITSDENIFQLEKKT